jgi:hypothetical protein
LIIESIDRLNSNNIITGTDSARPLRNKIGTIDSKSSVDPDQRKYRRQRNSGVGLQLKATDNGKLRRIGIDDTAAGQGE